MVNFLRRTTVEVASGTDFMFDECFEAKEAFIKKRKRKCVG